MSSNDDFLASLPDKKAPPPPPKRRQGLQAAPGTTVLARGAYQPWMLNTLRESLLRANTLKTSAALIGVSLRTLMGWLAAGQKEGATPEMEELWLEVERARAECVGELVDCMRLAAPKDWRAAHALLQAHDPDTFSPQRRGTLAVTVTHEEEEDLSGLTDEELEQKARIDDKIKAAKALKKALPA